MTCWGDAGKTQREAPWHHPTKAHRQDPVQFIIAYENKLIILTRISNAQVLGRAMKVRN